MVVQFGFRNLNKGFAMNFRYMTTNEKFSACAIIASSIKNQFLLRISFSALLELDPTILDNPQFELQCDLHNGLEFSPNQRKNLVLKTSYLTDSTFFTYFLQINEFFERNKKIEFEGLLNFLTISFRCLEN